MKDWKPTTTYTMPPDEIEKLLSHDYGDRLKPVNEAKMAERRRQRAREH